MEKARLVFNVDDHDFSREILESKVPALVDFWASWCGPCQVMAPVIEELAREYEGRLKVAKLSVEENPQTPRQYGVRGIPTLILFKEGEVSNRVVGVTSKEKLREMCEEAMKD